MEIQRQGPSSATPESGGDEGVGWGDVFVKTREGDYRFLFTLYSERYVRRQRTCHAEEIRPSPADVILRNQGLQPSDIVRAVIKWVNLYGPDLKGKPIRLESEEVLRDLVCDPGVEAVLAEPPGPCPDSPFL